MGQRATLIKQIPATVQGSIGFSAISGDSVKKQKKKKKDISDGNWSPLCWLENLAAGPECRALGDIGT